MANLFNKAKFVVPKNTKSSKNEKIVISINDHDFFDKLETLEKLQDNIKRDKAQADMLNDEIKDLTKYEWSKLYEKSGKNPGSVVIESKRGNSIAKALLAPSDKYITINAQRADDLIEEYGQDIVEEETTFTFDDMMIEKYGEILSKLIEECDEIDDDDKEKIIKAQVSYSISKGTIDRMSKYGNVNQVLEQVKPVFALKNVEIIEG